MRWKSLWLLTVVSCFLDSCLCLKGSELVLRAKAKADEEKLNPTTEEVVVNEDGTNSTVAVVKKPLLTGIPQKDYIHDPNLPRELKGSNLTDYPFYNAIPKEIEFPCDGLHDGFYASVPHHCQVYHHCLFGTRYDFLCANYTAFDQKTFICQFVSEVDCANSPKYYIRNEALYKAADPPAPPSTTTAATTTTTSTTTKRPSSRRRRPSSGRRRRPIYEYYEDEDYYQDDYYDEEEDDPPPRKSSRKQRPAGGGRKSEDPTTTTSSTTAAPVVTGEPPLTRAPSSVYARTRVPPPKIRPPVPINERHKYEYKGAPGKGGEEDDEEYYDEEEYEDPPPPPPKKKDTGRDKMSRRRQGGRKRPSRYDDDYEEEEEEEERPRMRKGNRKEDDHRRHRNRKGKPGGYRDEEDDMFERPMRGSSRKRHPEESRNRQDRRPPPPEYEYYDDEEEEKFSRRRTTKKPDKRGRTTTKKYERTTEPPVEEEYEEYEDEEEEVKNKKKGESTTLNPHRFSTSSYKSSKTTTVRPPVTYARTKSSGRYTRPSTKRVETSTEESTTLRRPIVMKATIFPDRKFTSLVGAPSGFKKQEEKTTSAEASTEAYKEPEKQSFIRRPSQDGHRKLSNFRKQQEEDKKEDIENQPTAKEEVVRAPSRTQEPPRLEESRSDFKNGPTTSQSTGDSSSNYEESSGYRGSAERNQDPASNVPAIQEPPVPTYRNNYREDNQNFRQTYRGQDNASPPRNEEAINFRSSPRDQSNFRNQAVSQENTSNFRNMYKTEDTNSYRNSPAVVENQPSGIEDTSNYRTSAVNNANYRNPHTSYDDSGFKSDDSRFRAYSLANGNGDSYQKTEIRWPPKEESFVPIEVTQAPPAEDNKPYLTGPGQDQTQEGGKTVYPPAITSPPRGYRRYNKMKVSVRPKPVTEGSPEYKYRLPGAEEIPKVEFTAPGPSGPPQATARPPFLPDIAEYDVTLNDALQPSTPYTRLKSRGGYQAASVTHPSFRTGYLLTAASQTYPAKLDSDYDAVVLPATRYSAKRRPHDWYW